MQWAISTGPSEDDVVCINDRNLQTNVVENVFNGWKSKYTSSPTKRNILHAGVSSIRSMTLRLADAQTREQGGGHLRSA